VLLTIEDAPLTWKVPGLKIVGEFKGEVLYICVLCLAAAVVTVKAAVLA